jgi:hypothetical protein
LSFAFRRLANKDLQQQKNLFDRNKSKIGALTTKGGVVSQVFYRNAEAYNAIHPLVPHWHYQEPSAGRRMSVQLSSAIKEGLHGTIASDPAKQNLLRRASMQSANTDLTAGLASAADVTTSTLLPLIKRCAVVSQVRYLAQQSHAVVFRQSYFLPSILKALMHFCSKPCCASRTTER